jgi:hypothetical protein
MTVETDNTFEQCKRENIDNLNFQRIITAIRATSFGWGGANADKPADWFLQRCIAFAVDVMDSAYNHALECNEESFCECGGFRAIARPNGVVMLQFVIDSWWPEAWEEDDGPGLAQQTTHADGPFIVGPRRILKLHKEQ